jgi:sulfite dehydrogenase (quinone) subunit SoeA
VRTGYSAIADEWVGIRPGTDGLFVMSLIHELLNAGKVDLDYPRPLHQRRLAGDRRPGDADDGLIARDAEAGRWSATAAGMRHRPGRASRRPSGRFTLADGRGRPGLRADRRALHSPNYAPDAVAERCGIPPTIRRIAAELADAAFDQPVVIDQPWTDVHGPRHETMVGRPVAMHAMRGISAHSNGFHTCRAIHLLQMLLGTIDTPGGFRYKAPFPKPIPPGPQPPARPTRSRRRRWAAPPGLPAGPRTCWSRTTARPGASTRPSPGTRRWPPTG